MTATSSEPIASPQPPSFECAGCGFPVTARARGDSPFTCPRARRGDDIDHVVRAVRPAHADFPPGGDGNPFTACRGLLSAWQVASGEGLGEERYTEIVGEIDRAVEAIDGRGLRATPFEQACGLSASLGLRPGTGGIRIKDETRGVAGTHDWRQLAAVMLHLVLGEDRGGRTGACAPHRRLAAAARGASAVAAAVVARAVSWPLQLFVPASTTAETLARVRGLGASVEMCERQAGVPGDPACAAFRAAVRAGAVPFSCRGRDNGLSIEGAATIAWEMVFATRGLAPLDAVFVQAGSGALASGVYQGFAEALRLGAIDRLPRLYAVQARASQPLARAYHRVIEGVIEHLRVRYGTTVSSPADIVRHPAVVREEMRFARTHRAAFMWPWEPAGRSAASAIVEDEADDWAQVVEGMLLTGGAPVVVGEEALLEANAAARAATSRDVDCSATSGLAGYLATLRADERLRGERAAVIFSSGQA